MKVKLLFFLLILGVCPVNAQDTITAPIGIGLFRVSLNAPIPLYHTIHDKKAYDTINFNIIKSGDDEGKYEFYTQNVQLVPYAFYGGSSNKETGSLVSHGLTYLAPNFTFKVSIKYDNAVEVYLNEQTGEKAVIKFDDEHQLYLQGKPYWGMGNMDTAWFLYETWEIYLKRLMSIRLDRATTKAYDKPNGKVIKVKEIDYYTKIKEVNGNWIRTTRFDDEKKSPTEIWLKWNNGYKPTVGFTEEIYY